MQAFVFDLGGTHLRCGVVAPSGALTHIIKLRMLSVGDGACTATVWSGFRSAVVSYVQRHRHLVSKDSPLIIAFPGPVLSNRWIVSAPTLTGASDSLPDLAVELEALAQRTVYLLNDVSAAAWHFAESGTANRFMVVTVSSGIGSKVFDRQHSALVLDEPGYCGEIGRFVVDDRFDAAMCECGGLGHLAAIASGRGVEQAARRRATLEPAEFRHSRLYSEGNGRALENEKHIVPAALAGDRWSLDVIRACTRPLSRTLLTVHMALGLQRIFLIGGFAQALGSLYLDMVRSQMFEMSRYAGAERSIDSLVHVVDASEEVCLAGCASFMRRLPMQMTHARANAISSGEAQPNGVS